MGIRRDRTGNPSTLLRIRLARNSLDFRQMRWLADVIYLVVLIVLSPVLLPRMAWRGKLRTDWAGRFGHVPPLTKTRTRILLHAVSVGEVNAIRTLVDVLDQRGLDIVVSVTTDTGIARAESLFGDRHQVVRYPYDFSWVVSRFLRRIEPDVIALVELEIWPNMVATCQRRRIPVCVINGRLSHRSFRRYRLVRWMVRPSFGRLAVSGVQSEAYAEHFRALGASPVLVTDSMKWDNAVTEEVVPGATELAEELGIDQDIPLVVAGSTGPNEPALLHQAVPSDVQLLCAPRRPEWFDAAARAMPGCIRRTVVTEKRLPEKSKATRRFLLDTIGELRQAYALADIVVVGRSFGNLFGSDVTEPIGLGKPTIVGPAVSDFTEMVTVLVKGGGLIQILASELAVQIKKMLDNPAYATEIGKRGRAVIRSRQGAALRHARLLQALVNGCDLHKMSTKEVAALIQDESDDGEERAM